MIWIGCYGEECHIRTRFQMMSDGRLHVITVEILTGAERRPIDTRWTDENIFWMSQK